jgi:hypothetical protein
MTPDTRPRPTLDRPAHWQRAPVGFRLVDGGNLVGLVFPTRPTRRRPFRWVADRIDRDACAGDPPGFATLADAVRWVEGAEWCGPVAARMVAPMPAR